MRFCLVFSIELDCLQYTTPSQRKFSKASKKFFWQPSLINQIMFPSKSDHQLLFDFATASCSYSSNTTFPCCVCTPRNAVFFPNNKDVDEQSPAHGKSDLHPQEHEVRCSASPARKRKQRAALCYQKMGFCSAKWKKNTMWYQENTHETYMTRVMSQGGFLFKKITSKKNTAKEKKQIPEVFCRLHSSLQKIRCCPFQSWPPLEVVIVLRANLDLKRPEGCWGMVNPKKNASPPSNSGCLFFRRRDVIHVC